MEALELYREETRKLEEHKYLCQSAEKEVEKPSVCCFQSTTLRERTSSHWFFFLQLPPPKPNPILVAFGNISVSGTLMKNICHFQCQAKKLFFLF